MKELALILAILLVVGGALFFVIQGSIESSNRIDAKRAQDCVIFDRTVAHIATYDAADAIAIDKYRGNIC